MEFLIVLYVIILGIVEGITEWLPVSSTGHLIIAEKIFSFMIDNEAIFTDGFMEMFDVLIQLGAILAVVIIFFKKLWPFGFEPKTVTEENQKDKLIEDNLYLTKKDKWILWAKVLVACVPAAIIGLLFDDFIDSLFYNPLTISITLIIYGILFIVIENIARKKEFRVQNVRDLSFRYALIIGAIQLLALIPGTSRSGVTILGAILLSCDRKVAAEFSFFLSIPVMFGASLLKLVKFLNEYSFTNNQFILLAIGMLVSFTVSILTVKALMNFLKSHTFKGFGVYRIVFGVILIVLILSGFLHAF